MNCPRIAAIVRDAKAKNEITPELYDLICKVSTYVRKKYYVPGTTHDIANEYVVNFLKYGSIATIDAEANPFAYLAQGIHRVARDLAARESIQVRRAKKYYLQYGVPSKGRVAKGTSGINRPDDPYSRVDRDDSDYDISTREMPVVDDTTRRSVG